jgi:AP2 domain
MTNGVLMCLGVFATEEDGARAYDFAARKMFGPFCRLNFPEEVQFTEPAKKPPKPMSSQYKGVMLTRTRRWLAYIGSQENRKYLGTYDSEREAAAAYDRAAREFYGEFCRLNFPDEQ